MRWGKYKGSILIREYNCLRFMFAKLKEVIFTPRENRIEKSISQRKNRVHAIQIETDVKKTIVSKSL